MIGFLEPGDLRLVAHTDVSKFCDLSGFQQSERSDHRSCTDLSPFREVLGTEESCQFAPEIAKGSIRHLKLRLRVYRIPIECFDIFKSDLSLRTAQIHLVELPLVFNWLFAPAHLQGTLVIFPQIDLLANVKRAQLGVCTFEYLASVQSAIVVTTCEIIFTCGATFLKLVRRYACFK